MASTTTRYTARFQLPELLERGRAETIQCPVYRAGALVSPTEAGSTVSVYDDSNTAIVSGAAVTVSSSIATYSIASNLTSSKAFGEGWWVEWLLIMPDGVTHRFRNDAALVRNRLYPTITDADIIRRMPSLDPSSSTVITSDTDYQDAIDEADVELQLRLIERGQRPWMVATPSALRQTWLCLAIAIVLEDLSARMGDTYAERAREWRERYEAAYAAATIRYDRDEDGQPDGADREAVKPSVIWLGGAPRRSSWG